MRDPDHDYDFDQHHSHRLSDEEWEQDRTPHPNESFPGSDGRFADRPTPIAPRSSDRNFAVSQHPKSASLPADPGSAMVRPSDSLRTLKRRYGSKPGFLRKNDVNRVFLEEDVRIAQLETSFVRKAISTIRETHLKAFQEKADSWLQMGSAANRANLGQFLAEQKEAFERQLFLREQSFDAHCDEYEAYIRTIANPRRRQRKLMALERKIDSYDEMIGALVQHFDDVLGSGVRDIVGPSWDFE